MSSDERRNRIRRMMKDLWNDGRFEAFDELYAPHCSFHDPSFPVDGPTGEKDFIRQLRAAHPDLHVEVHDILVDGDLTCVRWTMGGTARHEFFGMPATGKSYVMTGMAIDKWDGDRIVEEWVNYDLLGALQQTGAIPEMTPRPATT